MATQEQKQNRRASSAAKTQAAQMPPLAEQVTGKTDAQVQVALGDAIGDASAGLHGHAVIERDQEHAIKREMSIFSLIGMSYCVCNSWAAIAGTLSIGIAQGGSVTLLYGFLLVVVVALCVALSSAELASSYPTAGGQYHWACVLSPKRFKRPVGYLAGFMNIASWIINTASACLILAQGFIALGIYYNDSFIPQRWQLFIVYQAFAVLGALWVGYGLHHTPFIFQFGLCWSLMLFGTTFLSMLAGPGARGHYQSHKQVWATFTNEVGWETNAIVFLTGLANPNYGFLGLDAAIHMAEDCIHPARDVPRALIGCVVIGALTAFPWLVAAFYSMQDIVAVATTPTAFPYLEILQQTLLSKPAVTALMVLYLVNTMFGVSGNYEAASRLTWSFAMDDALLGSKWLSRLNHYHNSCLYALALDGFFVFLLGCLYLASTTVYNAIIGCGLILSYATFAIPIGLLLYDKRKFAWRPEFALGSAGWLPNIVTVLWVILITVFYCFPPFQPVTSSNMNYSCVVLLVIAMIGLVNWLIWARKHFKLPNFVVEAEELAM